MLTNTQIENLKDEGLIPEEKMYILKELLKGSTQVATGLKYNISDRTVRRYITQMNERYAELHRLYPNKFPL